MKKEIRDKLILKHAKRGLKPAEIATIFNIHRITAWRVIKKYAVAQSVHNSNANNKKRI